MIIKGILVSCLLVGQICASEFVFSETTDQDVKESMKSYNEYISLYKANEAINNVIAELNRGYYTFNQFSVMKSSNVGTDGDMMSLVLNVQMKPIQQKDGQFIEIQEQMVSSYSNYQNISKEIEDNMAVTLCQNNDIKEILMAENTYVEVNYLNKFDEKFISHEFTNEDCI